MGIDRGGGVGGESGDRQEEWVRRGTEWGCTGGSGVGGVESGDRQVEYVEGERVETGVGVGRVEWG